MLKIILLGWATLLFVPSAHAAEDWKGLPVAPESECSPYDERDYTYDRHRDLIRIWREVGAFFSPYDEMIYPPTKVDIEHRVSRHQAHVSGMCADDKAHRRAFASDPDNQTIAERKLNRVAKGDKDAAGWLPAKNRCHFAISIVQTKCKWGLSVDEAERDALQSVLAKCGGVVEYLGCNPRQRTRESWSI